MTVMFQGSRFTNRGADARDYRDQARARAGKGLSSLPLFEKRPHDDLITLLNLDGMFKGIQIREVVTHVVRRHIRPEFFTLRLVNGWTVRGAMAVLCSLDGDFIPLMTSVERDAISTSVTFECVYPEVFCERSIS